MAAAIIRFGDFTSHGGKVTGTSTIHTVGGLGISSVGDSVHCPLLGHGVNVVVEGCATYLIGQRMVALHGLHCVCGCT